MENMAGRFAAPAEFRKGIPGPKAEALGQAAVLVA
jgi:hypothetical protein